MVNKRGWIRIVEASIAVLIIFAVVLSLYQGRRVSSESDLSSSITPLLEEIAKNNALRDKIITEGSDAAQSIKELVGTRIREPNIGYDARVCEIDEVCGLVDYPEEGVRGNVYAGSRLISSSLKAGAEPKKISIFLWIKG